MEQIVIAERLVALRKQANLSQARVAEALSVSRQAVSKWESGKASPSVACYAALAALYGVSPDRILSGKDYEAKDPLPAPAGESFAEKLRAARAARALSQGELADALAVSRQSVSKWERGESEPDADRLLQITLLLDTPLSLLFPGPVLDQPVTESEAEKNTEEMIAPPTPSEEPPKITIEEEHIPEAPVVKEEPVKAEETKETPIGGKRSPQAEARYRKMLARAVSIRRKKKKNAEKKQQEKQEKKIEFRTISDIGPNDTAYVYVNKNEGKVRTMLPLLAAVPICAAAFALMTRKKYRK